MKNLIDLEIVKTNIKNKVYSNNFSFTREECYVINLDEELKKEIIKILETNLEILKEIDSKDILALIDLINPMDLSTKIYIKFYEALIDKGMLDISFDLSFFTETELEDFEAYIITKLKSKGFRLSSNHITDASIKYIIRAGRLDLINDDIIVYNLSDNNIFAIQEYYKKNQKLLPKPFYPYIKNMEVEENRLSLEGYLISLENKNIAEEDYQILLSKIKASKKPLLGDFNWQDIYSKLSENQKFELTCLLLDFGHVDNEIISYVINDNNYDVIKEKYLKALKINTEVEKSGHIIIFNQSHLQLLKDDSVVSALIDSNKIITASYSSLFKDHILSMIHKVNLKAEEYKEVKINQIKKIEKYPNLLKSFIGLGNNYVNFSGDISEEMINFCKNQILAGKLSVIPDPLINDNDFLNQLIINDQLKILVNSQNVHRIQNKIILSKEACDFILEKCNKTSGYAINFFMSHKAIIINNPQLLNYFLRANDEFAEILLYELNRMPENLIDYNEEMFLGVKDYFIRKYNFNERNLLELKNFFGCIIIRYLNNDNIIKMINLSSDEFDKIIALFPKMPVLMSDVEKIYDSLKQYEFSKKYPEKVSIFSNIMHSLNDIFVVTNYLKELITVMDEKFYQKFESIYPTEIESLKINPLEYLVNLIKLINSGDVKNQAMYFEILHTITDYYIREQREEYRKTYNMYEELSMPYNLDEKDTLKQFIKHKAINIHKNLIILNLNDLGLDYELAEDCIDYYVDDKRDFSPERLKLIEKNIYLLVKVAKKIVGITGMNQSLIDELDDEDKIRRHYYVEQVKNNSLMMLMELRIDVILDTYLKQENKAIYNSLLTCINKYKLHLLPTCFNNLLESPYIFLTSNIADIVSFITYYQAVYEMEERRLKILGREDDVALTFTTIMKYAEAFSSVSSVYNQVLGIDEVRLIKSNPNPNSASNKTQGDQRLREAVNYTINNFKREYVTIPAFNEILTLSGEKNIRVVIGNFTHPCNVTYGERTGSCMRIGGLGESLFEFCLEDENGFHIRFENPETGEFISRVSGFRNGNSVYLNELRYSCNLDDYSNSLVVEACKKVAELLILKSKKSTLPIENVFVHNAYAIKEEKMDVVSLGIDNNKKGLTDFYSDIKEIGVVLASTGKPFKEINFDKSNMPKYRVAREVPYEGYDNGKLRNMINRVNTMNKVLQGFNYEYVEPIKFDDGLEYGIASQDWYVYIDLLGNIYYEYIACNDDRILNEINEAKRKVEQYKQENIDNFGTNILIHPADASRSAV